MRRIIIAVGVLAVLGAACVSSGDAELAAPEPAAVETGVPGERGVFDEAAGAGPGEEAVAAVGGAALPSVGPSVIKTADLRVEVERGSFRETLQRATAVAEGSGGFLVSSRIEGEDARSGSLVIRVPSERFEVALSDLRDLGDVRAETVSGEDVSEEFVDLEARLRNFEAQEAVLLRLMDRARTVADTIKVQRELTTIQLEVERIRGRLRFLEDRTALGTISLSLFEAGAAAPAKPGVLQEAWQRAVDVFLGIVAGAITLAGLLPLAAVALIVWVLVRRRPKAAA